MGLSLDTQFAMFWACRKSCEKCHVSHCADGSVDHLRFYDLRRPSLDRVPKSLKSWLRHGSQQDRSKGYWYRRRCSWHRFLDSIGMTEEDAAAQSIAIRIPGEQMKIWWLTRRTAFQDAMSNLTQALLKRRELLCTVESEVLFVGSPSQLLEIGNQSWREVMSCLEVENGSRGAA